MNVRYVLIGACILQATHINSASSSSSEKKEVVATTGSSLPTIKKINDDLYVGHGYDHYFALERVTLAPSPDPFALNSIDAWIHYARSQAYPPYDIRGDVPSEGNRRFLQTLREYQEGIINNTLNELWVAYISDRPITGKATFSDENPHIIMFVTVITSPDAQITSHAGISRTWESIKKRKKSKKKDADTFKKHSHQSAYLHSFAAQVMRRPDIKTPKKYLLTTPVRAMLAILVNTMPPGTLFIGDDIYKKKLESITIDKDTNDNYRYLIPLLVTHPPRIIRIMEPSSSSFATDAVLKSIIVHNPDGSHFITMNNDTPIYQWFFTPGFRDPIYSYFTPYALFDLPTLANKYWAPINSSSSSSSSAQEKKVKSSSASDSSSSSSSSSSSASSSSTVPGSSNTPQRHSPASEEGSCSSTPTKTSMHTRTGKKLAMGKKR